LRRIETSICRPALAIIFAAAAFLATSSNAAADMPDRIYVGNFLGYNAEPANYASVQGQVSSGTTTASGYFEKTVSPDSSLSLFGGLEQYTGQESGDGGWQNLELSYKHVVVDWREHELMLSLAPSLEIPVGDSSAAETHPRGGADFLYLKGFGDLPESVAPLRALAIEGDFYWDSKLSGARDDLMYTTAEIEYSIDYLDANVIHVTTDNFLRHLTPHLDFEWAQYFSYHRNISQPDFELTPAVAWLNGVYEVNLGAQIAMNRSSASTGTVSFVWLLGVSLDNVPPFSWNMFH
jgi:hypothetical protein